MHPGWIAVIVLLVFGGVVCLVYLEAKNSCIQYALAPHVTRAREDAKAAGKGLWNGVKWAGTRAVRIWFGWWPALGEGAFMVAAWGWAIKFRAFNPKVRVNKASFASPFLLTLNVTFAFPSYCVACKLTSRSADNPLLRQDLGLEAQHHGRQAHPPPTRQSHEVQSRVSVLLRCFWCISVVCLRANIQRHLHQRCRSDECDNILQGVERNCPSS